MNYTSEFFCTWNTCEMHSTFSIITFSARYLLWLQVIVLIRMTNNLKLPHSNYSPTYVNSPSLPVCLFTLLTCKNFTTFLSGYAKCFLYVFFLLKETKGTRWGQEMSASSDREDLHLSRCRLEPQTSHTYRQRIAWPVVSSSFEQI